MSGKKKPGVSIPKQTRFIYASVGIQNLSLRCIKYFAFIHLHYFVSLILLFFERKISVIKEIAMLCVRACTRVCVRVCVCACLCPIQIFGPVGRDISDSTATRFGLDGPGIEFQWRQDFSPPVQSGLGAYTASYTNNAHSRGESDGRVVSLTLYSLLSLRLKK